MSCRVGTSSECFLLEVTSLLLPAQGQSLYYWMTQCLLVYLPITNVNCNGCFRTETSFCSHFNNASNTTCERVKPKTRLVVPERSSLPGDENLVDRRHLSFLEPSVEFQSADFDSSSYDIDRVWETAALLPVELDPDFIKLVGARLQLGDDSHSDVSSSSEEDDVMFCAGPPTYSFDYDSRGSNESSSSLFRFSATGRPSR